MKAQRLGFAFCILALAGSALAFQKPEEELKLSSEEKTLLEATNKARAGEMLPELKPNAKLFQAARGHSKNMAKKGELNHTLDGKEMKDRVDDVKYRFIAIAENIAAGTRFSPQQAVEGWLQSPGHRKNMLNKEYTEIGLGVAKSTDGTTYYTQVFGKPRK